MEQNPTSPPAAEKAPSRMSAIFKDYVLPALVAFICVRLLGIVGGLAAIVGFYVLRPKLGTPGAVAAGAAIGVAVWFTASSLLLH